MRAPAHPIGMQPKSLFDYAKLETLDFSSGPRSSRDTRISKEPSLALDAEAAKSLDQVMREAKHILTGKSVRQLLRALRG